MSTAPFVLDSPTVYALLDDVDRYPASAGTEGDPVFRILSAKNIGLTITLADITEEEFRVLELIEEPSSGIGPAMGRACLRVDSDRRSERTRYILQVLDDTEETAQSLIDPKWQHFRIPDPVPPRNSRHQWISSGRAPFQIPCNLRDPTHGGRRHNPFICPGRKNAQKLREAAKVLETPTPPTTTKSSTKPRCGYWRLTVTSIGLTMTGSIGIQNKTKVP